MTTPLFQFNENRADIEREVALRAVDGFAQSAGQDPARSYQLVLNDAAFHEINRLEKSRGKEAQRLDDWKNLARRIGRMTEPELRAETLRRAEWYVNDVVGHFDKRVYRFATSVLPVDWAPFNTTDVIQGMAHMKNIVARIRVEGDLESLQASHEREPPLLSQLTRVTWTALFWVVPYARSASTVHLWGGKNLFVNPIGYFMRNLGAYRVDNGQAPSLQGCTQTLQPSTDRKGYHSLSFLVGRAVVRE